MIENKKFERHLRESNLSENTISSYMFAIKQYGQQYDDVTQKKLPVFISAKHPLNNVKL